VRHSPFRHAASILRKKKPIHLTFFLTRRCNSRCPFCFYLKSTEERGAGSAELTVEEIRKISSSLGGLLWLAFSGGEIYLRDDLVEISRAFYERNKPAIMLFPTNGLLPEVIRERTEQIVKECSRSVIAVKLSLDGLGPEHDRIRNTPGSFGKTLRTYELLGELIERYPNFELGVNTVFCSGNQDGIDGIIDFVRGMKNIKTHTISLIRGDLSDEGFKNVDFAKYLHAIGRLEDDLRKSSSRVYRFRGAKIKAAQDVLQRRLIHRTAQERKRLIPCYAGRLNLVLTECGDVYPCEILPRSFGNVKDYGYDLREVARSVRADEINRSIVNNECYCTHECYFMTNILFNPALYPALFREYLRI
jgi:MoaA/NifB/PqqE/SkfB family radical SAM enzyme